MNIVHLLQMLNHMKQWIGREDLFVGHPNCSGSTLVKNLLLKI